MGVFVKWVFVNVMVMGMVMGMVMRMVMVMAIVMFDMQLCRDEASRHNFFYSGRCEGCASSSN